MDAKKLFKQSCEFVLGATNTEHMPASHLPEVAFVGRSNVGKSSLLNALTGRNSLARTSQTPGRTRQLNFFNLGDRLMLVDLPGYGYAKASKSDVKLWQGLMRDYLRGRAQLQRVLLLIDSRHGIKPNDEEMMQMLGDCAVSYQIVLTKADKCKKAVLEKVIADMQATIASHGAAHPQLLVTSSEKGEGIDGLREAVAAVM